MLSSLKEVPGCGPRPLGYAPMPSALLFPTLGGCTARCCAPKGSRGFSTLQSGRRLHKHVLHKTISSPQRGVLIYYSFSPQRYCPASSPRLFARPFGCFGRSELKSICQFCLLSRILKRLLKLFQEVGEGYENKRSPLSRGSLASGWNRFYLM